MISKPRSGKAKDIKGSHLKLVNRSNIHQLKKLYFESPIGVWSEFLVDSGYKYNTYAAELGKSFTQKKFDMLSLAATIAEEKAARQVAKKIEIDVTVLAQAKQNIITYLLERVNQYSDAVNKIREMRKAGQPVPDSMLNFATKEAIDILDAIRRELGEPNVINKNLNINDKTKRELTQAEAEIMKQLTELEDDDDNFEEEEVEEVDDVEHEAETEEQDLRFYAVKNKARFTFPHIYDIQFIRVSERRPYPQDALLRVKTQKVLYVLFFQLLHL